MRGHVVAWVAASLAVLATSCDSSGSAAVPSQSPVPNSPTATSSAGSPPTTATPTTAPPTTAAPTPPPEPSWTVGASPLPTTPDGYGEIRDTPAQLINRDLPTTDLLPPPMEGGFHSEILGVDPLIRERMGETWSPQCPVPLEQLRYVTVSFWGFDDRPHTGELVVNASVATDVVSVFRDFYAARFPIEEMRLITTDDVRARPTGDGNNTAAYICRPAVGQTSGWSAHAYGLAIDVNPFQNPYQRGDLVLPELASAYLDRGNERPGMILPAGLVVSAFRDIGWAWGGDFQSLKDYMHVSQTGR